MSKTPGSLCVTSLHMLNIYIWNKPGRNSSLLRDLSRGKCSHLSWLCPYLALPMLHTGIHFASWPKADTSGQVSFIHTSKTKQMFSDVWSNICCLWSCPSSSLSPNSNYEAWWHQQTTSHVPKALPNCNNLCAKVQQVPESLHRCPRACCDVPSAAERGNPNSATSLSSCMAHQTTQPVAHVKCPKYIFQLGSMCPRGLFADTSRLIPWKEAEVPIFQ